MDPVEITRYRVDAMRSVDKVLGPLLYTREGQPHEGFDEKDSSNQPQSNAHVECPECSFSSVEVEQVVDLILRAYEMGRRGEPLSIIDLS